LAYDPLFLATAIEGALACGRIQRKYFRSGVPIEKKGPIDLVTAADLEAEREFRRIIGSRFPKHAVIGEEADVDRAAATASHRWIIDPVDGTTNFAHGLALFSVSIALEIDGAMAVGVVFDPMGQELFTAERGEGARLNGMPIHVSSTPVLLDALFCTGFPYSIHQKGPRDRQVRVFSAFLGKSRGVRRLGSAALDLCYVAAGRLEGFWEDHLHPWDMAAGALLVQEAGGRVTDYNGAPCDLNGGHIIATNGRLHDDVLSTIREVGGPLG